LKLLPTRIYRKGERAYFGGSLNDAVLHWPNIADYHIVGGDTLTIDPKTTDEGVLKLFTEAEATGILLLQQGHFLLHASSVLINGYAYVFCGTPGAGKSTTVAAFVKAGYAPLADDMTVIGFDENRKPFVIPQGPTIKIWQNTATHLDFDQPKLSPCFEGHDKFYCYFEGDYPTKPVPLGGIYLLHRSNRFGLSQQLPFGQVPFELIKHFPLPHQLLKGEYLQKHFTECLNIAKNVPIIRQKRPEGFDNLKKWVANFGRKSDKSACR
jgi:hypothetical protein